MLGLKSYSHFFNRLGPFKQLLVFNDSAEIPLNSLSTGISLLSKASPFRFATKLGCLLPEFNQWSTVVLSVHKKVFYTGPFRALSLSSFKRLASNAACCSSCGMESAFMGATLAFGKTKETCVSSELFTWARKKASAQNASSELSPNLCNSTHSTGAVK